MVPQVTCTILGITHEAPLNNPHLKQHYQCRAGSDKVPAHTAGVSLPGEGLLCSPSFMPLSHFSWHPQQPHKARLPLEPAQPQAAMCMCHAWIPCALLPCSTHHCTHDQGPPNASWQTPASREVQHRGFSLRGSAGSEPGGRSAVESPSHPSLLKDFFRICC